jgi:hypothetical protein
MWLIKNGEFCSRKCAEVGWSLHKKSCLEILEGSEYRSNRRRISLPESLIATARSSTRVSYRGICAADRVNTTTNVTSINNNVTLIDTYMIRLDAFQSVFIWSWSISTMSFHYKALAGPTNTYSHSAAAAAL